MIIPPTWNLPDSLRARLGQSTYGRQRALVEEGHLLLVLHQPPGPDDTRREGVLFWRSPAGEWLFSRGGPGPGGLRRHVQSYVELEARLAGEQEGAESTESLFGLIGALTPLVRAARNQHAALQSAREAFKGDALLIGLRDQAYEVERNLELLLEDARNALSCRMARDGEEQARLGRDALRASHRLNVLMALTLPLTAITSVFGMGLPHGLAVRGGGPFWLVFAVGLALGWAARRWMLAEGPAPAAARR